VEVCADNARKCDEPTPACCTCIQLRDIFMRLLAALSFSSTVLSAKVALSDSVGLLCRGWVALQRKAYVVSADCWGFLTLRREGTHVCVGGSCAPPSLAPCTHALLLSFSANAVQRAFQVAHHIGGVGSGVCACVLRFLFSFSCHSLPKAPRTGEHRGFVVLLAHGSRITLQLPSCG
jgi:hypothetical protein